MGVYLAFTRRLLGVYSNARGDPQKGVYPSLERRTQRDTERRRMTNCAALGPREQHSDQAATQFN